MRCARGHFKGLRGHPQGSAGHRLAFTAAKGWRHRPRGGRAGACLLLASLPIVACSRNLEGVAQPPTSTAVTTATHSMIFLARVDGGVMAVDLGWFGAAAALDEGLARLDADTADVIAVFLTHSHRDHIAAWPRVRHATFHLVAAEVDRFTGLEPHQGWIAKGADAVNSPPLPAPGELTLRTFDRDTAFVFGTDTVHAFPVPGHTSGSAAYLLRGVLFLGDAVSRRPFAGFVTAKPGYSDDTARSRAELVRLFARLEGRGVRWACSAHAECAAFDETFRRDVLGPPTDSD